MTILNTEKHNNKKTTLYIRTDGNAEIGTGHVMRCLSVAKAYSKSGGDCVFITADTKMKALIEEKGFPVTCLDSVWNDLDKETDKMEQLINERKIERLFIDSYFVTPDYLSRLNALTYLQYLDDMDAFIYPCSELINYNVYAVKLDYPSRYPGTKLKIGPKYAPLRDEFLNLPPRQINETVKSILITSGGNDPWNVSGQIVKLIKQQPSLSHLHINIVVGRFNKHNEELDAHSKEYSGITLHQNINDISLLMCRSDIAISAGGSTLYELSACGTPTIVFSMAENQVLNASAFGEGYMLYCGDIRDGEEKCINGIMQNLEKLSKDYNLRQELSNKCHELVDGHGALRIADSTSIAL